MALWDIGNPLRCGHHVQYEAIKYFFRFLVKIKSNFMYSKRECTIIFKLGIGNPLGYGHHVQ